MRSKYSFSHGTIHYFNKSLKDLGKYEPEDNALFLGQHMTGIQEALRYKSTDEHIIAHTRITSIHHEINQEGWFVNVGWGMDPKFHIERYPDVQSPPAFGFTPGLNGMHEGIVAENSGTEDSIVKVTMFNKLNLTLRKSHLLDLSDMKDKYEERLKWFRCKKGDAVTVLFTNDDPNAGIVVASSIDPYLTPLSHRFLRQ